MLVHSGDVHGGHYFVLIKPSADGNWLRFDDDRVVPVTEREVLEDNFGGESLVNGAAHPPAKPPLKGAMKRFTNAYMLVYIREVKVKEILAPISTEQVPEHLRELSCTRLLIAEAPLTSLPVLRHAPGQGAERRRAEEEGTGRAAPLPHGQGLLTLFVAPSPALR